MAYLARVQKLLTARGLIGVERKLKPFMRKLEAADLAAVAKACDAVFAAGDGVEKK